MSRVPILALCALLLTTGCAPLRLPFWRDTGGMSRGMTVEGLRQELAFQASTFAAAVSTAGDDIRQQSQVRRVRRNAVVWRLEMIPMAQRAAFIEDPRAAYVRMLLLTVVQRRYLESGDGRDLFGAQQGIAIDAAKRLEQDLIALGERFLSPTELRRVVAEVNDLAEKYPMQGREFSLQRTITAARAIQQNDVFTQVLSLPLAPFRALEGVDSGAQAIREFNVTARRFAEIASQLPEQIRGELELLLYDLEDRDTVMQSLAAFESLAASADRASTVAEALPEQLKLSLDEAGSSVERITAAVEQLRGLAAPLDAASANLRDASVAWREVIGSREERESKPDDGRSFDVREWESAANAIGGAAGQLRGLAQDAGGVGESDALAHAIDQAVDRAFWRAAALIGLFFLLLLVYRVISSLLPRPAPRA